MSVEMNNLVIGETTYDLVDDEKIHCEGYTRDGSCVYTGAGTTGTPTLQMKRESDAYNSSMLVLNVQEDKWLKLQSVPYVDGEDDWSNVTSIFDEPIYRWVLPKRGYKYASVTCVANTYKYIGRYVTIPSNYIGLAYMFLGWQTGTPTGMGIHTASSGTPVYRWEQTGSQQSPVFLLWPGTWYFFERRNAAATNTDHVYLELYPVVGTTLNIST